MSKHLKPQPRKPATKFAQLRKKMQQAIRAAQKTRGVQRGQSR